ncbi:MAG: DegV family protein, partial [Lachnospiraceae bacterium]|nr:DegV family protein [Lachnospiraceae bacterium]
MSYKIVVDSCCELPAELKNDPRFVSIPLGLEVGDYRTMDDDTFNQSDFLARVAACPTCPKSSCPSPEKYMEAFDGPAEDIYVVTIAANLSGSHNSAELGKKLFLEKKHKNIYICDSESASCGEAQIAIRAMEMAESGMAFAEVVRKLETFRDNMKTYFVLDNLETLRKNGRLTGVKALVASTLSIKPVMSADKGVIVQKSQAIGIKKAL